MYCVIIRKENIGAVTGINNAFGAVKIKCYYCENKKLALKYLETRYERSKRTVEKMGKLIGKKYINAGVSPNGHNAIIEYVDNRISGDAGYTYTRETFNLIRGNAIIESSTGNPVANVNK